MRIWLPLLLAWPLPAAQTVLVEEGRIAAMGSGLPVPRAFVALAVDGSPRYGHLVVRDANDVRATLRKARGISSRVDHVSGASAARRRSADEPLPTAA